MTTYVYGYSADDPTVAVTATDEREARRLVRQRLNVRSARGWLMTADEAIARADRLDAIAAGYEQESARLLALDAEREPRDRRGDGLRGASARQYRQRADAFRALAR